MRTPHRRHPQSMNVTSLARRERVDREVPCLCWCESATVGVLQSELKAGLTKACAKPSCQAIDLQRRKAKR